MAKEKSSEQDMAPEAVPVEEIAQLIVSRAYSKAKDIQMVVDIMSDAMSVLAEKFADMSEVLLKVKDEFKKYSA